MVDRELVKEWMVKADEDFGFAHVNLQEAKPFYAQICFHFHQAAEKYLKAYIVAHDLEFRKIHDLLMLLKICLANDTSFDTLREDCEYLNAFYAESRYPVHWPTRFTDRETQRAFLSASQIRSMVREKLFILDTP